MVNDQNPCDLATIAHHGIALDIFDVGVIIFGKSGIGKSELGLELIDRGHRLICDDLIDCQRENEQIIISAPQEFGRGFMEVRGIGFVDIPRLYGAQALCAQKQLFMIIQLVDHSTLDIINYNRLHQLISTFEILGVSIPYYQLPTGANRNLAILLELMVRYAKEQAAGYDSHQAFINQQFDFLNKE